MTENLAISLENISKVYRRYNRPVDRLKEILLPGKPRAEEFWALRDISLKIQKGERVGIIGSNGAGKSTLLQVVAGTLTPTTGNLSINGRVSALLELGSGFDPEFTGRENIFFSGRFLGLEHDEIEARFDDIAAFADIGDFIDQPVKTYSSGMYVRLAFSLAVSVQPEILIVDEALSVGDTAFQFKSFSRLEKLMAAGVTVILVSHDIGTIKSLCDRVVYLRHGAIKAYGDTDEVTDLYFLDVQSQQKQDSRKTQSAVKAKKSLSGESRTAFGTDEGRVVNVRFLNQEDQSGVFNVGDRVFVEVTVEYLPSLKYPSVCLSIENRRSLMISGQYMKLSPVATTTELIKRKLVFSFEAGLIEDTYFLTARLESRQSEKMFFPIDKQAGALSFTVIAAQEKGFLGLTNLKMDCHEESLSHDN